MHDGKRYARPDDVTSEQAAGKGLPTSFPSSRCSTSNRGKLHISDILHVGSENGVTLRELVQITGEDERMIRRRIQAERKAGALILSDCKNGYFRPADARDVQRFIRSMSRRAREISEISRAAEDALARTTGQEIMEGW